MARHINDDDYSMDICCHALHEWYYWEIYFFYPLCDTDDALDITRSLAHYRPFFDTLFPMR